MGCCHSQPNLSILRAVKIWWMPVVILWIPTIQLGQEQKSCCLVLCLLHTFGDGNCVYRRKNKDVIHYQTWSWQDICPSDKSSWSWCCHGCGCESCCESNNCMSKRFLHCIQLFSRMMSYELDYMKSHHKSESHGH